MSDTDVLGHGFWLASRSAGVVAYIALSASVVLGLLMATRLAPLRARATLRAVHERIALIALAAIAAHGLLLLGDSWLHPGLLGTILPLVSAYRPFWTGLGILGGYLAMGLSLTFYVRGRIGARRWRKAHRLIPVAWAFAVAHTLGAGTDAGSLWLQAPVALSLAAIAILLAHRWAARRPHAAPRAQPVPASQPPAPASPRAEAPPELWFRPR